MTEQEFRELHERHERRRAAEAQRKSAESPPAHPAAPAVALYRPRLEPALSEQERDALRERQERHRRAELEQIRAATQRPEAETRWLEGCGVGLRHRQVDARAELVPAELRGWAQSARPGASAILCGPTGSGKTASAIWAMRTLYRAGRVEASEWRCASAAFASASELFARVFEKQPLAHYERVDLLVIDDWGMAYETDWPLSVLDRLIDRRWSEMRSTIITTNLKAEELEERYPRICSRLRDSSGPGLVELDREDLRRVMP